MNGNAPSPPDWAEAIFKALLPPDRAETESGDLLEVYRDEQWPAHGEAAADWWYLRQVGAVVVRTYGLWVVALIALFVLSDVASTYRLAIDRRVAPIVAAGLIVVASVQGGWRARRVQGGLLAGVATCAMLWLFMAAWWVTLSYPLALVQQSDPYWIDAWQSSAAPGETFAHWIFLDNVGTTMVSGFVLNTFGVAAGLAGGYGGAAARRLRRA